MFDIFYRLFFYSPPPPTDYLDMASKGFGILFAITNLLFAVKIFFIKDKKENENLEKNRKMLLLKSLILDHNLKHFYSTFASLEQLLKPLTKKNISESDKKDLEGSLQDQFVELRVGFYDLFLGVDKQLHSQIETLADNLLGELSSTMYNEGINLYHPPTYKENIESKLLSTKTRIIETIFLFRFDS